MRTHNIFKSLLVLVVMTLAVSCKKNESSAKLIQTPSMIDKLVNPADSFLGAYSNTPGETNEKKLTYIQRDNGTYVCYSYEDNGNKDVSTVSKVSPLNEQEMKRLIGNDMMEVVASSSGLMLEMKKGIAVLTKVKKGSIYKAVNSAGTIPTEYALITPENFIVFTNKVK